MPVRGLEIGQLLVAREDVSPKPLASAAIVVPKAVHRLDLAGHGRRHDRLPMNLGRGAVPQRGDLVSNQDDDGFLSGGSPREPTNEAVDIHLPYNTKTSMKMMTLISLMLVMKFTFRHLATVGCR